MLLPLIAAALHLKHINKRLKMKAIERIIHICSISQQPKDLAALLSKNWRLSSMSTVCGCTRIELLYRHVTTFSSEISTLN